MAIVQISKIQQRTGANIDLPQLDVGEFGFATDERRLYIGNDTELYPPESGLTSQTEVLTEFSRINFSQMEGTDNTTIAIADPVDGQIFGYNGTTWTNKGGNVGGLIDLGQVPNVKIDGGINGYFLQTDGDGHLTWSSGNGLKYNIASISRSDPGNAAVITTTEENLLTSRLDFTAVALGDWQSNLTAASYLNQNVFYALKISDTEFEMYQDSDLLIPIDTSNTTTFPNPPPTNTGNVYASLTIAGASVPGGASGQIQFNDGGVAFGGSTLLTYNKVTGQVTATGNINAGAVNSSFYGPYNGEIGTLVPNLATFTSIVVQNTANITGTVNAGNITSAGNVDVTSTLNAANINAIDTITADLILSTNNGGGTNFKVGDDAWIGDVNVADTISLRGVQNAANAYIVFGNVDTTSTLGRSGNGPLTYNGSFTSNGTITSNDANLGNSVTANYYAGTLLTSSQLNVTTLGNLTTLKVDGVSNVGPIANLVITGGNVNEVLQTNGSGNLNWYRIPDVKYPQGPNGAVQFNKDGSNFHGQANFMYSSDTGLLSVGFINANAASLFYIPGGNVVGTVPQAGNAGSAISVTGASQSAITSLGVLTTLEVSGTTTLADVTADSFTGDGSALTDITGENVIGFVANAVYANTAGDAIIANIANSSTVSLTVTNNAQPNITSVGSLANLSVIGNILIGNASVANTSVTLSGLGGNINIFTTGTESGISSNSGLTGSGIYFSTPEIMNFRANSQNVLVVTDSSVYPSTTKVLNLGSNTKSFNTVVTQNVMFPDIANGSTNLTLYANAGILYFRNNTTGGIFRLNYTQIA